MELTQQEKEKVTELWVIYRKIFNHPDNATRLHLCDTVRFFLQEAQNENPNHLDVYLWHLFSNSTGGTVFDFEGQWSIYTFIKRMEKRIPS